MAMLFVLADSRPNSILFKEKIVFRKQKITIHL